MGIGAPSVVDQSQHSLLATHGDLFGRVGTVGLVGLGEQDVIWDVGLIQFLSKKQRKGRSMMGLRRDANG